MIFTFSDTDSLIIYIIVYLLSTCCFSLYKSEEKRNRILGIFFSILIPSVFAGIRFRVGTDYSNYYNIFLALQKIDFVDVFDELNISSDLGFYLMAKIFLYFLEIETIYGLYAFVIVSIFVYTILSQYKQYNLTLSYLFFLFIFFSTSLNILRQCVAVVIIFYSLKYIFCNNLYKFLLFIALSAMIHSSAIIVLPLYFMWNHKQNRCVDIRFIFIVSLVGIYLWQTILKELNSFGYFTQYSNYMKDVEVESNNITFYIKFLITLLTLYFKKYIYSKDFRIQLFVAMYIIGTMADFLGFFSPYIKRIGLYYSFSEILIVPMFVHAFKDFKLVSFIIITLIILYFTLDVYTLKHADLIPYRILI